MKPFRWAGPGTGPFFQYHQELLTVEEFGDPVHFEGWDFENVWSLEDGVRPVLRNHPETTILRAVTFPHITK